MEGCTLYAIPMGLWWEPWGRAITDRLTLLPALEPLLTPASKPSLTSPHGKSQLQGPMAQDIGQSLGQLYILVLQEFRGGPWSRGDPALLPTLNSE